MPAFTLSNLATIQTRAVHAQSKMTSLRRRWIHTALRRQAIMMPAISPFMSEGTITRWKVQEGESFSPGDVLLQIENDLAVVDIEACNPGIMGKILTPDGTPNIPVEAVIAIVARDTAELEAIQRQSFAPTPPSFIQTPSSPSSTIGSTSTSSPRHASDFKLPLMSPRTPTVSPRTPSLFELHTMGHGNRNAHVGGPKLASTPASSLPRPRSPPAALDLPPVPDTPASAFLRSSAAFQESGAPYTPASAAEIPYPKSSNPAERSAEESQLDGAAIRRMILANLASSSNSGPQVEDFV